MEKPFLASILLSVLGTTGLGFYYINNPSRWFSLYYDTIFALQNTQLLEDLNRSKASGYKPELTGYTTKNTKGVLDHARQYDLWSGRGWYAGQYQVRNNPVEIEKGQERIQVIQDYSVKLQTPCGSGTGWFLDYVLPKGSQKYPTKWFIATNAHVIDQMYFKNNPYQQLLPATKWSGCWSRGYSQTPLFLFKEKVREIEEVTSHSEIIHFIPELWSKISRNIDGAISAFNVKNYRSWKSAIQDPEYLYFEEENANLFYVPTNFLGLNTRSLGYQWTKPNYYKDFAVLEVDFKDEEAAKLITWDFYGKYDLETGSQKNKVLNLFADELLLAKTNDELLTEQSDYFIAGYPSNVPNQYRSYGNYSPVRKGASRLTYLSQGSRIFDRHLVINQFNQPIIGHMDVGAIDETFKYVGNTSIRWGGIPYNNWGYNYLLDNSLLGSGASGSLTTDENGNILGLYRMHDASNKQGYVEPIRSKGLYKDGKIILPKYDLIEGDVGQLSSFKHQVSKYYLSSGYQTSLSKHRKWK